MEENIYKNNIVSALEVLDSLKQSINNQDKPSDVKCYSNFGSMDFQSPSNSSETKSIKTISNKNSTEQLNIDPKNIDFNALKISKSGTGSDYLIMKELDDIKLKDVEDGTEVPVPVCNNPISSKIMNKSIKFVDPQHPTNTKVNIVKDQNINPNEKIEIQKQVHNNSTKNNNSTNSNSSNININNNLINNNSNTQKSHTINQSNHVNHQSHNSNINNNSNEPKSTSKPIDKAHNEANSSEKLSNNKKSSDPKIITVVKEVINNNNLIDNNNNYTNNNYKLINVNNSNNFNVNINNYNFTNNNVNNLNFHKQKGLNHLISPTSIEIPDNTQCYSNVNINSANPTMKQTLISNANSKQGNTSKYNNLLSSKVDPKKKPDSKITYINQQQIVDKEKTASNLKIDFKGALLSPMTIDKEKTNPRIKKVETLSANDASKTSEREQYNKQNSVKSLNEAPKTSERDRDKDHDEYAMIQQNNFLNHYENKEKSNSTSDLVGENKLKNTLKGFDPNRKNNFVDDKVLIFLIKEKSSKSKQ